MILTILQVVKRFFDNWTRRTAIEPREPTRLDLLRASKTPESDRAARQSAPTTPNQARKWSSRSAPPGHWGTR